MRLLICTQKVDRADPILGFFHRWIEEFAKHCDSIIVICLEEGERSLPENVRVYSLGKEKSRQSRFSYVVRFVSLIWQLRREYDAVFVHMNAEYVVLGGLLWRVWHKPTGLWYVHKQTALPLRFSLPLVDRIFTASRESFPLKSAKTLVVGHGIDTALFSPGTAPHEGPPKIVSVGRIAPVKQLDLFIDAYVLLKQRGVALEAALAGAPVTPGDYAYAERIEARAKKEGIATPGSVPFASLSSFLRHSDIFMNASATGGLDKAVLDAMACGVVPVTSNVAFEPLLKEYGLFVEPRADSFAEVIGRIAHDTERRTILSERMAVLVREHHSLEKLIPRILSSYAR